MSSVTVKIPTPLRPMTGGQAEVKIEGATVGEEVALGPKLAILKMARHRLNTHSKVARESE